MEDVEWSLAQPDGKPSGRFGFAIERWKISRSSVAVSRINSDFDSEICDGLVRFVN
jgi:hypothetical protein